MKLYNCQYKSNGADVYDEYSDEDAYNFKELRQLDLISKLTNDPNQMVNLTNKTLIELLSFIQGEMKFQTGAHSLGEGDLSHNINDQIQFDDN